jgi:hypothetical protein
VKPYIAIVAVLGALFIAGAFFTRLDSWVVSGSILVGSALIASAAANRAS